MTTTPGRVHEMEHHTAERATTRPVVSGTQGVVSAGHPLVAMAGMRMLLAGGNAFDAAAAAGFAAAVVEPTASYTLCGECVAVIHDARRGETRALSGQGTAPAMATIPFFRGRGLDRIPTGPGSDAHLSFTVPGAMDAYLTLLETYGTRTVSEVLAPALDYAERGFPMYEYMHRMLGIPESQAQFDLYPPGGRDVFYPGGRVPPVGTLFTQPALAGTLRRLVETATQAPGHRMEGIAAARARFYRGDLAAMIGAFSERLGGLLRASDRGAHADHLRRARDPRPVHVDAGAGAHAGARDPRRLRSPRPRPQLRALYPHGGGSPQAGLRGSRAILRRPGARAGAPGGAALARVREGAGGADPHGSRGARGARGGRSPA
jgi:gamma-glutamyltranspeptidase